MSNFDKNRIGTGTKEWSEHSYNIQKGCKNNCLYCYARANALRFKQITSLNEWTNEVVRENAVKKAWGKKDGVIMFPTTHDITPDNIEYVVTTLRNMLSVGNDVLIVSKPHISCIVRLCNEFANYKEQIMFRFTIGSTRPDICSFWEPGAPCPSERITALQHAYDKNFKTSVSIEPMLDGYKDAIETFKSVEPHVTDTIWIGKMNKIRTRVDLTFSENMQAVNNIERLQSDSEIMKLTYKLMCEPDVRWKDSIKKVMENCAK